MRKYKIVLSIVFLTVIAVIAGSVYRWRESDRAEADRNATFYITNDIHYIANQLTDHGEAFQTFYTTGDGKQLEYIDELVDAFSEDIRASKPEVLIISGDLTSNGEKLGHQELAEKLGEIEKGGTSVYVIPGNHDLLNPWARGFSGDQQYVTDYVTPEEFALIYSDYGYNEALTRDQSTLSYLAEATPKVWVLMLDTTISELNLGLGFPQTEGRLTEKTLEWIRSCSAMAKEKGARIVTVMHHNILHHSDVIRYGYTLDDNEIAVKALKENNFNLVFSGHIHVQDISSDQTGQVPLYDIANGSLAVNPHQYGVLQYSANTDSFDYSTVKVDVEGWAKRNGITDPNLLNFTEYAENYFGGFAYDRAYKRLSENSELTEEQKKTMAETMRTLNINYFAGIENTHTEEILQSEGYRLWKDTEDFQTNYLDSILKDIDTEDTKLHIE